MLAGALPMMSLDVVGIVAEYGLHKLPTCGAKPKLLFTLTDHDSRLNHNPEFKSRIAHCTGLTVSADGNIWAAGLHAVAVFDSEGRFLFRTGKQVAVEPAFLASDLQPEVFVLDYQRKRVTVCALDGRVLRVFSSGAGEAQSMTLDARGCLVICDEDGMMQVFTRDGLTLRTWATSFTPRCFTLSTLHEQTLVAHKTLARIEVYDKTGHLLRYECPSGLRIPRALSYNEQFRTVVACYGKDRLVQLFYQSPTSELHMITEFGGEHEHSEYETLIKHPRFAAVDYEGRVIVADTAGVHVFAFD